MIGAKGWSDLAPRLGSALVLAAIAGCALWFGGYWFTGLIVVIIAAMHWELGAMLAAGSKVKIWCLTSIAALTVLVGSIWLNFWTVLAVLVVAALIQRSCFLQQKNIGGVFSFAIMSAGTVLIGLRQEFGLAIILWLILVVVFTDVAGYFVGKTIGGPKFWAKISPKKTWSGTLGGWVVVAVISLAIKDYVAPQTTVYVFVIFAVFLSFAGQMGDICESALKRACGVKDSSNLLPGHGGLLDRFDAMVGATLGFTVTAPWVFAI